jgi:hypothetical protein
MVVKYYKWPQNVSTFSIPRPSKIHTNWDFLFGSSYSIWQPCLALGRKIESRQGMYILGGRFYIQKKNNENLKVFAGTPATKKLFFTFYFAQHASSLNWVFFRQFCHTQTVKNIFCTIFVNSFCQVKIVLRSSLGSCG